MHSNRFERCGFGMFPNYAFLHYLIEWGGLDDVMELWEDIDDWQEQIDDYFKEYKQADNEKHSGILEEEIQKILKWKDEYRKLLGEE